MTVPPGYIITAALSIAISGYSVFNLIFERNFVKRYRKFRDAFDRWRKKEITSFYMEFQKKVRKLDPTKTFEFIDRWVERQRVVNELPNEHDKVRTHIVYSLVSLGLASLSAIYVLYDSSAKIGPYLLGDVSLGLLGLGIGIIFLCIYECLRISARILAFELGTPIEKVVEDYIEKSKAE